MREPHARVLAAEMDARIAHALAVQRENRAAALTEART